MKLLTVLFLALLLIAPVHADVIRPCPVTSPRCVPVSYFPNAQVQVIWWNGYYCHLRSKPESPYVACKPFQVDGVRLGWIFYTGR